MQHVPGMYWEPFSLTRDATAERVPTEMADPSKSDMLASQLYMAEFEMSLFPLLERQHGGFV